MTPRPRPPAPAVARLRPHARRLLDALTTPLLPADYLGLVAPLTFGTRLRGRIVERRAETRDATTLVIRPGRGWAGHRPGQYVRLGVDIDGVRHWRTYSLTSRPSEPTISITVARVPRGVVSNHLVDAARPGDLVHLDAAAGEFVLPAPLPERILFLTAGSGITPVMGMLHGHEQELRDVDVVVVHSAPRPQDVVLARDLRDLAARGSIRLVERHTRTEGRLDLADLDTVVPDWRERSVWACGPTTFLDAVLAHWDRVGLARGVHVESFRPARVELADTAGTATGGELTFTRSGVTATSDGIEPVLESGEAAGVLMPSGCRMGICFGCVAPLSAGSVRDLRTGDITTAQDADPVLVQTCISAPVGACSIDL